ncbi:MAG: M43 family zinc metalloprotease [Bacteroidota bacterium]|nr:M43 family zinc metalloprotease [Bacteroidota bacterium]
MKIRIIGTVISCLFSLASIGQSFQVIPCITDEIENRQEAKFPEIRVRKIALEAELLRTGNQRSNNGVNDVLIIPVVIHIMHNNGPERLSDLQIKAVMSGLNNAFRKRNKDSTLIRNPFKSLITDTRIEFQLASTDPNGNCTSGITRTITTNTVDADDNIKSEIIWDSKKYLNIWVVRNIGFDVAGGFTVAGYSNFPWSAVSNPNNDGIVMDYRYMTSLDKTLAHEVGHYFGLFHTFQDGCSSNQSLQGDRVTDTPPVSSPSYNVSSISNTCKTDFPDVIDMYENYMDYNDRKLLFTLGQVNRMHFYLNNTRKSLISEANQSFTLFNSCATNSIAKTGSNLVSASIYPNPIDELINIKISSAVAGQVSLITSEMTGKVLSVQKVNLAKSESVYTYSKADLGILASGLYIITITGQQANQSIRLYVK